MTESEKMRISCQHYWVIETPNSTMSLGRCKFCGETKEFINSMGQFGYNPREKRPGIRN
jgi:hypothetical protein